MGQNILIMLYKLLVFLSLFLTSCIGTESYYQSQTAYYNAQAEANRSYLQAISRPLAQMQAPDGTVFIVNNPNIQKPVIQDTVNPVVDTIKTIVNSTPAGIVAGGFAVKEIMKVNQGVINNNGGTVNSNSGNTPDYAIGGTITDNTATPTIVNQEKAVIVNQDKAVIVNQPEPVIIRPEVRQIGTE